MNPSAETRINLEEKEPQVNNMENNMDLNNLNLNMEQKSLAKQRRRKIENQEELTELMNELSTSNENLEIIARREILGDGEEYARLLHGKPLDLASFAERVKTKQGRMYSMARLVSFLDEKGVPFRNSTVKK